MSHTLINKNTPIRLVAVVMEKNADEYLSITTTYNAASLSCSLTN